MTLVSPVQISPRQLEFSSIGHHRPWVCVNELLDDVRGSDQHVVNLINDGSIDFAIDIRTPGSSRPCYRIFHPSLDRFNLIRSGAVQKFAASTPFEELIKNYLPSNRNVLTSVEIATHWHCSEQHVLNLAPELSIDVATASSSRTMPRTTRTALIAFMKARQVQ